MIYFLLPLLLIHLTHAHNHIHPSHGPHPSPSEPSPLPYSIREYWMRAAVTALSDLDSPCPFAAFGTVIVNHTDVSSDPRGRLVCMGVNEIGRWGNPILHGEMAAINNCSEILTGNTDAGGYGLDPEDALKAFKDLSLYTTAESCPMCASAIRWSGFKEYIYATSIETLVSKGWGQILIPSEEVFKRSKGLEGTTVLLPDVLANETDGLFSWQFDGGFKCPEGCVRSTEGICEPVRRRGREEL